MRKLFLFLLMLISITSFSQTLNPPKRKFIEGSILLFTDGNDRIGIGAATPMFLTINVTKDLRIGPALMAIAYRNINTGQHDWNKGGMALRVDYKRLAMSFDIATISGVDNKFFGIGIRF